MRWFLPLFVLISLIDFVASSCWSYRCATGALIDEHGSVTFGGSQGNKYSGNGCALAIGGSCTLVGTEIGSDRTEDSEGNVVYTSRVSKESYGKCTTVTTSGGSAFACSCNSEDHHNCHLDYVDELLEKTGKTACKIIITPEKISQIGQRDDCFTTVSVWLCITMPILGIVIICIIGGVICCVVCGLKKKKKSAQPPMGPQVVAAPPPMAAPPVVAAGPAYY